MSWIPKEELEEVKKISLITYLEYFNPEELVKTSQNEYKMKSHDSLKLSNGMWKRFSSGDCGRSALDYLIKVEHMKLPDAVKHIEDKMQGISNIEAFNKENQSSQPTGNKKSEYGSVKMPIRNDDNSTTIRYLRKRGIDSEIIEFCINNNLIYESKDYHNVVFVGYDGESKKPRFAEVRSANFDRRYVANSKGSRKEYSFRIVGEVTNKIHIFEGPIDLLSYMTMVKMHGANWREHTYISLSGVNLKNDKENSKDVLAYFLSTHPEVEYIYLHLDNDEAGRTCTKYLIEKYEEEYLVIDAPPLSGKDCNENLLNQLKEIDRDRQR